MNALERQFLGLIHEAPGDLATRLAYADWLTDAGRDADAALVTSPRPVKDVPDLLGLVLAGVSVVQGAGGRNDEVVFTLTDGRRFRLWHEQECTESVNVEDVIGDVNDLVGSPLAMAEKATNSDEHPDGAERRGGDSFTWTFYRFATARGYVTIRWHGSSNGYYSEEVGFAEVLS